MAWNLRLKAVEEMPSIASLNLDEELYQNPDGTWPSAQTPIYCLQDQFGRAEEGEIIEEEGDEFDKGSCLFLRNATSIAVLQSRVDILQAGKDEIEKDIGMTLALLKDLNKEVGCATAKMQVMCAELARGLNEMQVLQERVGAMEHNFKAKTYTAKRRKISESE